jgi:hypothetical protein
VRDHVSNIITKLQVVDRSAAISWAREAGLGEPERSSVEPWHAGDGSRNQWRGTFHHDQRHCVHLFLVRGCR